MTQAGNTLAITGSFGYIGRRLLERLKTSDAFERIICTDILPAPGDLPPLLNTIIAIFGTRPRTWQAVSDHTGMDHLSSGGDALSPEAFALR